MKRNNLKYILFAALLFVGACSGNQTVSTSTGAASHFDTPGGPVSKNHSKQRNTMTLLWETGNSYQYATDGQCGTAIFNGSGGVTQTLVTDPSSSCLRNQLNPLTSPGASGPYPLTAGTTYEWDYQTIAHMGVSPIDFDNRLIWQIHQFDAGSNGCDLSPATALYITTYPTTGSNFAQYFNFVNGQSNGKGALAAYTEGATDSWKIQVYAENNSTGTVEVWHNGSLFSSTTGPVWPSDCSNGAFWNFGPYDWTRRGPSPEGINWTSMKFYSL